MRIRTKSLLRYFTQAEEDLPPSYVKMCERLLKKFNKGFKLQASSAMKQTQTKGKIKI
tara:strand:+ start:597 stop:770 length:174 start_codon:yes stop_codon:yes gene_type:complete